MPKFCCLFLPPLGKMAEDAPNTIGDAIRIFEHIIRELRCCPFGGLSEARIFDEELINKLRQVADKIEGQRRKKNFGVIGGSATSIVGGAMAITGAALAPFTFGTSIGLIVTGTAIGITGAGVSLGFAIDKRLTDKKKIPILQDALEKFIKFQKDLAVAVTLISVCERQITKIKTTPLVDVHLRQRNEKQLAIMTLERKVHTLCTREGEHRNIDEKIQDILQCGDTMAMELKSILDPIKPLFSDKQSLFEDQLKEARENPFNILESCVPRNEGNDSGPHTNPTFQSIVRRFVWARHTTNDPSSRLPRAMGIDAAGSVVARSGVASGRIGLRFLITADNIAKVGGSVLKIARAVSVAGIILGAIGVAADIGFLGHAVYDLKRKDADALSQAFIDLANVMEEINDISTEN